MPTGPNDARTNPRRRRSVGTERAPGTDLIRIADVDRLLAPILTERDVLREEVAALQEARLADLRASEEARRADAEELGRLRGRLEAVEAELERSRQLSPNNPPNHPPTSAEPPRRRWPWSR